MTNPFTKYRKAQLEYKEKKLDRIMELVEGWADSGDAVSVSFAAQIHVVLAELRKEETET